MAGSGSSMKMVTRAWWLGMTSDEDARAALQDRLRLLSRLMFVSFVALLGLMFLLYRMYPGLEPHNNHLIYGIAVAGMLALVVIWRSGLSRRPLSIRTLYAIDAFYGLSSGATFASATCLASELKMGATANILWACFVVFLRTIIVPSTGKRTVLVSIATLAPMVMAAAILSQISEQEFPPPALVGSAVVVASVVTLLAATGSNLIYGLRMQVSAAIRLGQYTLDHKIGAGGNGEVYRARHALLRRPTAIKLMRPDRIDPDTLDRFEREVQHMSQLTHPNTVAVFDYGRSPEGILYYAMEYLDGIDLEKLVHAFGPQPGDRAIAILIQVCGALQEAHNRGLIHRDIKPANIILCERGDVPDIAKVVDFGLVKEITADSGRTQRILGTPAYLAPEIVGDPDRVGPATDLYALGAVGYFLITGRPVFEGKNALDMCVQHVTATPTPPSQLAPGIAPELEAILLRCLAKDPTLRPSSATELARLLRAVPSTNVWTDTDALRWWVELKRTAEAAASTPTLTITIDLQQRDTESLPELPRQRTITQQPRADA